MHVVVVALVVLGCDIVGCYCENYMLLPQMTLKFHLFKFINMTFLFPFPDILLRVFASFSRSHTEGFLPFFILRFVLFLKYIVALFCFVLCGAVCIVSLGACYVVCTVLLGDVLNRFTPRYAVLWLVSMCCVLFRDAVRSLWQKRATALVL